MKHSQPKMTDYSTPEYKDLYAEIIKDHNFRFGKFSPIPYPLHLHNKETK